MDRYRIDGHKLIYHVDRVHDWLEGKTVYPIYVEISPSRACNHRCTFCALDFMEYSPRFLEAERLKERLSEMASLGVRSLMHGGEGEPLLHRKIGDIIEHGGAVGIDQAVTTNAVLLKRELSQRILPHLEWMKVSCNAGTAETYRAIHRGRPQDFDLVVENLRQAARIKRDNGLRCVLGLQAVLLPENRDEIGELTRIARDIGLDYLVVKPYSHHPSTVSGRYRDLRYDDCQQLAEELAPLATPEFGVIVRVRAIEKWNNPDRNYERCLALPFWCYIDSDGEVWGCSAHLGDERFSYGNVMTSTFKEIWEGETRRRRLRWAENELDAAECRVNCRMDEINRYLWELKHPPAHVNFI